MRRLVSIAVPISAVATFFLIVRHASDWLVVVLLFGSFIVVGGLLISFPAVILDWVYVPKSLRGMDYRSQLPGIARVLGILFVIFGSAVVLVLLINHTAE